MKFKIDLKQIEKPRNKDQEATQLALQIIGLEREGKKDNEVYIARLKSKFYALVEPRRDNGRRNFRPKYKKKKFGNNKEQN